MAGPEGCRSTTASQWVRGSRIIVAIVIGILLGCVLSILYPHGFFSGDSYSASRFQRSRFSNQRWVVDTGDGDATHGTHEEGSVGSALPTQDHAFAIQPDHKQPYACILLPFIHGLYAPYGYGSQTMLPHFQGMNITSTRVPLPPDFTQGEAIYVNAKQYNAILRRRQYRSKLEAQNKLLKPRKPYLHESRHAHALKRARGPGGRFLNSKKIQETRFDGSINEQEVMGLTPCPENIHDGGIGSLAWSDVTTTSNCDYFQQQELKFSICNSRVGGSTHSGEFGATHHMFR
ncbi:hypothetical protein R6Q59_036181 [Mikania micrantha]